MQKSILLCFNITERNRERRKAERKRERKEKIKGRKKVRSKEARRKPITKHGEQSRR